MRGCLAPEGKGKGGPESQEKEKEKDQASQACFLLVWPLGQLAHVWPSLAEGPGFLGAAVYMILVVRSRLQVKWC